MHSFVEIGYVAHEKRVFILNKNLKSVDQTDQQNWAIIIFNILVLWLLGT